MQNRRMFWGSVMGSLKRSTMAVVDNIVLYTWKLLGGPILCFVFYCHNFLKKRIYCANIPLSIKMASSPPNEEA